MKKHLFFLAIAVSFFSCSNDDDNNVQVTPVTESFFGLQIDQISTYEYFRKPSSSEAFETVNIFTAERVISKMDVNGEEVYTIEATTTGNIDGMSIYPMDGVETYQVKDSLGYLIRLDRGIQYSSESINPFVIAENEWGTIFGELLDGSFPISTEAGSFNTKLNETYVISTTNEQLAGRGRYYYAEGIGLVLEEFGSVSVDEPFFQRILVAYTTPND